MAVTLVKHAYRTYRAAGFAGVWRRVSSPLVWKDAFPRLLYIRDRRVVLARRYIKGRGIEIGALHNPLKVSSAASVTYVDRADTDGLRQHYPEKGDWPIVDVGIVDDGETLSRIPAASQDFIIANQFLEHCQNPLGTIRHHVAKLKPGGILFYAIPNKRLTFDVRRPVTPFEHLVRDDQEGPDQSRAAHYREWLELVSNVTDTEKIEAKVREFEKTNYNIHFHVWDRNSIDEFIEKARAYLNDAFEVRESKPNGSEVIGRF